MYKRQAKDSLLGAGLAESSVHYELFFSAVAAQKQQERKEKSADTDTMSNVAAVSYTHLDVYKRQL